MNRSEIRQFVKSYPKHFGDFDRPKVYLMSQKIEINYLIYTSKRHNFPLACVNGNFYYLKHERTDSLPTKILVPDLNRPY